MTLCLSLWYSIKAVAERRGGQTEKRLEKNEKKFLTNWFQFDIINKLFRKRWRSEKFEFWKICFKNFEKVLKKFLTNEKQSDIINKLLKSGSELQKVLKNAWKQQIVPCKLNNDVLKILFDMNKVVVRTWNFESFLLLVNRWKSQLQLK